MSHPVLLFRSRNLWHLPFWTKPVSTKENEKIIIVDRTLLLNAATFGTEIDIVGVVAHDLSPVALFAAEAGGEADTKLKVDDLGRLMPGMGASRDASRAPGDSIP